GNFKLGREAAHSRRRIVHAHGDQTGAEVARTLIKRVKESERIEVLEKARILELIAEDGMVFGVRAAVSGKPVEIIADATVLATRDVVAREIFREKIGGRHVWLDARMLGKNFEERFPGIFAICRARGVDPSVDLIPVTPAAHYMMGGVVTDLRGRASLNRL